MNVIYNRQQYIKKSQVNKICDITWHCHMNALWDMWNLIGQIPKFLNRISKSFGVISYLTIKTLRNNLFPILLYSFSYHADSPWCLKGWGNTKTFTITDIFPYSFFQIHNISNRHFLQWLTPVHSKLPPLLKASHLPLPNRKIDRTCTAPISSFW